MKHGGAYRMGTRALALLMALLMMLSTGGFALRDGAEPQPEPMAEVPAETVSEPAGPEEVSAPSEAVTPPSEEVTPPSEEVTVPSEEVTAPSEEVTAPSEEVTPPSEDTPAPSEDPSNGENVLVGGVAPAPAEPDPAETTPEPTDDPNAGIMTVAETTGPKIIVTLAPDAGNTYVAGQPVKYILTIRNDGTALTGKEGSTLKIKVTQADSLASVTSSEGVQAEASAKELKITTGSSGILLPANALVSGTYTINKCPGMPYDLNVTLVASTDNRFNYTFKDSVSYTQQDAATLTSPDGEVGTPTPGNGGEGGGDDSGLTGTYNIVYHLNPPEGDDTTDVKSSEGSATFTVENLQNVDFFSDAGITSDYYSIGDYYFAGWDRDKIGKDNFPGYNEIDYPITNIPTSGEDEHHRLILGDPQVESTTLVEGSDPQKFKTDLYAVWAPKDKAGMVGYSMNILDARLGEEFVNGIKEVGSTVPQKLGNNGLSAKGAQKYSVLDGGWGGNAEYTVTDAEPTADGYVFVGWFNKSPNGSDYIVRPGKQTVRSSSTTGVYSLDALWGNLTPGNNVAVVYDRKTHSATFQGADGPQDKPDVNLTPDTDTYDSYSKAQAALEEILEGKTITVDGEDFGDSDTFPTETNPGVYTYSVKGSLRVPAKYYAGKDENEQDEDLEFATTTATLTIYPVLDLTVNKQVTGAAGAPTEKFNFTVTPNDADKVHFSNDRPTTLTAADGENDTTQLYFTENGDYTITVSETRGTTPGMTYADDAKTVTVKVEDMKITAVTVSDGTGERTAEGNGTADLTFTNEYKTGNLTVTKTVADGSAADQTKDFNFTVTLSDTSVSDTHGGVVFTNGAATFTLKHNESRTFDGLPAGVTYTVTETPDENYTTTSDEATGTIPADATATAAFTNTRNVRLTYHLNVNGLADATVTDTAPKVEGSNYTYTVQELGEVFGTLPAGASSYNSTAGHITVAGTMYYFMGWSEKQDATSYEDVNYRAQGMNSTTRKLVGDKTLTTTIAKEDLYAIWSTKPAMLGYTMTIADTVFGTAYNPEQDRPWIVGRIDDNVPLGDNTNPGESSKKYVVLDGGHQLNDKITVTNTVPTNEQYKFIGWYNDKADTGTDPNKGADAHIIFPGQEIWFGDVNTIYSLNAIWGQMSAADKTVPYNGTFQQPADATMKLRVPSALGKSMSRLSDGADATYTVTVTQEQADGTFVEVDADNILNKKENAPVTFDTGVSNERNLSLELPQVKEPGVYKYNITVRFTDKNNNGIPTEIQVPPITATAQFIIYPQLDLTVTKELQNGNTNVIGTFSFTVEATGAEPSKAALNVNVHSETQKHASTRLWFPNPGTYTVTVKENNLGPEVAPGVGFAGDQTVAVTVGDDYQITSVTPTATITAGNAAVALTFTNTYSGGDLVVTKYIENNGAGPESSFHFKVELDNKNITTKKNGSGEMEFINGVAEFDLTNGGSMKATALPAGINYTVTEDPVDGYSTTYAINGVTGTTTPCKGTVQQGNNDVVFTNTYTKVGQLTVTKTVTGDGAPAGDSFQFLLTLTNASGEPLTGKVGSVTLDDKGQYSFNLKHGETTTFTGLPSGTKYEVKEQNVPVGYAATPTNASGEIGENNDEVTAAFTNAYQTGDLTITKTVAEGGNQQHAFTIAVTAPTLAGRAFTMEKPDGTTEQVTFAVPGGTATVTLKDKESVTIQALPAGVTYTVTEPGADGLGYDVSGADSGTITAGTNIVNITNTYRGGSLKVTKTVTGTSAPAGAEFTFTVTLSDKTVNGPRGTYEHKSENKEINFASGVAELTLSDGESATIPGLPAGATYTVTEADVGEQGYTTTATGSTGTIQKGETATAAFTNDYHPGRLTVTKTVTGSGADPNATYHFTVELVDKSDCNHVHGGMTFTNGVATFDLKDGQSISADQLYTNTKIKITETTGPNYETSVGTSVLTDGVYECTIPDGGTHAVTAAFTNRYKTGGLKVSKTVVGRDADKGKPFSFTVTLTKDGAPLSGTFGNMTFDAGQCSFTLTDGEALTATGIPAGTKYTVTETEANLHGYKTTVNDTDYTDAGYTGTIEDQETATAAFTNTYESGRLSVTKVVTGQGSTQRDFYLSVDLSDETVNGQYGGMTFTNGVANFTLKHGESVTATGLPAGVTYEVEEPWPGEYTPSYTGQSGTIMKDQTAVAAVTNAYPGGDLEITKTVIGKGADQTKDFHFTVTLSDPIDGPRGSYLHKSENKEINFTDGVAELTLSDGESADIQGLRAGTTYTVTEAEADRNGYETTSTGATGTIMENRSATAAFTNRYCPGSLTITKTVDGGDTSRQFTFTVKLSDDTFNGTRNEVTFKNGVSTKITLAHNGTLNLSRLPLGGYTVTETEANKDGYETTVNGTAATQASGELTTDHIHGTAAFTNRFKRGSLTVSKTVADGEKDKDFNFTVTLGRSITGTFGGVEFKDGTASFTLHHSQSVTATDLPDGITYEVTEETDPHFATTAIGAQGIISDGRTAEAKFTNTRNVFPKLTLTVEKQTTSNWNNNVIGNYSFTVTSDPETVTISDPDLSVFLYGTPDARKDTAELTFPAPGTYTVTVAEDEMDDTVAPGVKFAEPQSFTVTVSNDYKIETNETVTADATGNATAALTFVNDYQSGDLVVSKTIENNGAGTRQKFHFKVDLKNPNITTQLNGEGEMVFTKGVAEFDLTNGGSMKATALPAGLEYTVTETPVDDYATTYTVNGTSRTGTEYTGNILIGENTVAFTNTYTKVGKLTVSKTVTGDGADLTKPFNFTVTLDPALSGTYGGTIFSDGTASFTLKHNESRTIAGLPSGTHYKVEELNVPAGYTATSTNATGTIGENNAEAKAAFTNTYQTGDLTITKTVDGGGNRYHQFAFTVYFEQPVSGEFQTKLEGVASTTGTLKFTSGESEKFYLQAAGGALPGATAAPTKITIQGLPAGISYWLVEDQYTEYEQSFAGDCRLADGYTRVGTGTIDPGENAATVNNHYTGGNLDVKKVVTNRTPDPNETFTITVTLDTPVKVNGPRGYVGEDQTKFISFTENVATFELKADEIAHIQGLPKGARYTVHEDEAYASENNYVVSYTNGTGVIEDNKEGEATEVTVTNSYQPGTLNITKQVAGVGADKTKKYNFTITQVGHPECNHDASEHGVKFDKGVAHVELSDGQSVQLTKLYANSQVLIQEDEANLNGYETTVNGEVMNKEGYTVTIGDTPSTFNANVRVVNTFKTGNLTVSKEVVNRPAGHLTSFSFTVTAKDAKGDPIQGTFGGMTFDAGQCTFVLQDGGSVSAENLPDGTEFTVTETEANQRGYVTKVNGEDYPAGGFTDKITYKQTVTAAFTNTYEGGNLSVTKVVTGQGSTQHEFPILVELNDKTVNGQYGDMNFAGGIARFTLRHGQTVTASNLPAGVTYQVTELRSDDYQTSYTNGTGTITRDTTIQATVTNTYPGGDLKITKTVIGAPTDDVFHFTVSLSDAGVNGPRGSVDFTDGVASFTLMGGQSVTIPGLRDGTTYTVTETDANQGGYETTSAGAEGVIAKDQTAEADFINRYCPGSLTVSKTVDGGDTGRKFTFTVTLSDKTFSGTRSDVKFDGGQATFQLTNGEHVTFDRLPLGGYTVTEAEADQDGYMTTVTGASGELTTTQLTGTAAFTNRFKRGDLTVTKTVDGTDADKRQDFNFTVTLDDNTVNGVYGDMNFTGGLARFTLRHGQSVTATGLRDGIGYKVTEDTDTNFTTTATDAEGTISNGRTAEAKFTNTHKKGSLSVSKEVTLAARGDEDKAFPFTVTLSDTTVNGTYGINGTAMTFENGVATFELKGNESKTATGLPAGVTATVTETDAEGYETTVNGELTASATVTVQQSGSADLHFVNRYTQSGRLSITKQVVGDGSDPDREFSFTVWTDDWNLNGGYGGMSFTRGTAIVALRASETVTAEGMPAGTNYTIYEDAATGYTATVNGSAYEPMSGVTGEIPANDGTAAVTFTNTYQTGDLTIAKTVNGNGNQYAKFHFTLTLDDDYIGGAFQTKGEPLTFLDGVAGFDLSDGQSITIHGLPAGVGYTLEEDPVDDYVPTITVNGTAQPAGVATASGTIAAGPNNRVDVANHYTGGNLKITKRIDGIGADPDDVFDFTLRLPNHPINGPRGDVTFVNGVASFTLKGGQSVNVQGLPNGAEYVVEEDAAKAGEMGYLVGYSNAHGYIHDNEVGQYTAEVEVTNTYALGDLVIAKRVTGWGADPDKEYTFTVTIQGGYNHGGSHGLTFENGVATFTLKDGQSQEIKHLLGDAELTITETEANADGYVTAVNGHSYDGGYTVDLSNIASHAATAVFENHRANGNLTVTKAVENAPAGRRTAFDFTVTLSDKTINGTYGNGQTGMTFTNGMATFSLADGQSKTATGLPADVTYTVTEAGVTGYTAASTGAVGVIEDGQTATAAFTNTYHGGDLTVTKTVSVQGNARRSFPITVTLDDGTISGTYGGMRFTDGTAHFTLTGTEGSNSVTATGLPVGVTYTVTEDTADRDGYTTTYKNETGTISEGAPAQVEIINHYAGGSLTVSKTVTGAGADPDAAFHFTVAVYRDGSLDGDVTGPRGACSDGTLVTFSNGTASFVLKNGQSAAIKGLPAGDTYTIREREANQNGYVTTVTGGTDPAAPVVAAGTVTEDGNATAAFTNAYQPGSLTVRKTVEGGGPAAGDSFQFTVTLENKTFAGDTGGVTFTAGQADFTLTDGQSVTFEGLPLGGYTVAEKPVTGYETTVNGQKAHSISGELTDQGRAEASFINRYIASDLTVANTVRGEGADLTKPFTFTVTLGDDTVSGQYGGMSFTAGTATFTLKHGESQTATGLPAVSATVVESDRDGYTTSVTSTQPSRAAAAPADQDRIDVTLAEGTFTRVDFVNEIKPVSTPKPTETAEPTATPSPTPAPVAATAAPTAPNTGDEARPVLWTALLALSALGLGAVLTLRRKKHD